MKNLYKIAFGALSALSLVACNDYLSYESLGSTVTAEQKANTVAVDPSKLSASVTAITSAFTVYGAVGGEDQHNDFGYPALMMLMDHKGTDLVSLDVGYNWFSYPLVYSDVTDQSISTYLFWETLYNQIYAANEVIASGDPESTDSTMQYYLGQAYSLRAFDYFVLSQVYQYTYVGHEKDLAVPVITDKNKADAAANGIARSTVEATYAQILSDINTAVDLLEKTKVKRSDKRYINLAVALGIRARIYMVMNEWSLALKDAQRAKEEANKDGIFPSSLAEAGRPAFSDCGEKNWMWGVLVTDKDRVATTGICNFPSHMGSFNYGYASVGAWRMISKKLYAAIPDTDVRKNWFLDANKTSKGLTAEELQYLADKGAPAFTQVKFATSDGVLGTSDNSNDVPLMRIEEIELMIAECEGMSGEGDGAATLTDFIQTYRNPSYSCSATGVNLQNMVWEQRRIELWGEGLSWFDIMRLKKGVDRRGHGFPETGIFAFNPEAPEFRLRIPFNECQYNKLVENNPEVSQPTPIPDGE